MYQKFKVVEINNRYIFSTLYGKANLYANDVESCDINLSFIEDEKTDCK